MSVLNEIERQEKLAKAYIDNGSRFLIDNNYKSAIKLFELAYEECKKFDPFLKSHPYSAMALIGIGSVQYINGDIKNATENFLKALEIRTKIYSVIDPYRPDTASLLFHLGNAYTLVENYNEALKYYNDSYITYAHLYDTKNDNVVLSSFGVGLSLFKLSRYDESKSYLNHALKNLNETNSKSEETAKAFLAVGGLNYIERNYDTALELYQEAQKIRETNLNLIGPEAASLKACIARALNQLHHTQEAIGNFTQSIQLWKDLNSNQNIVEIAQELIEIYKDTNNDAKISDYILNKLMPDTQQVSAKELITDGCLLSEIAKIYVDKEDYAIALDLQLKAFDIFENNNSPLLRDACDDIAITYLNLEDMTKHQEYVVLCGNIAGEHQEL